MTHTDDPADATISELLERIAEARAVLDEVVAPLSADEREVPLGGSWSVKLHLGHIADWEVGILALLRRESRLEAMGLTQALWAGQFGGNDAGHTDAMNATMTERSAAQSLAGVILRYDHVHHDLVERLATMADADLQLPYSHFAPEASPADPAPILNWIAGNTFGHYPEHAQWIRERLAAR
ncbi:MAG: DinB family protein [Anaerolineaceae bacterium]